MQMLCSYILNVCVFFNFSFVYGSEQIGLNFPRSDVSESNTLSESASIKL